MIGSISEYVQAVCQMNKDVRELTHIWDSELLFRGQADKDYELIPSIARNRHSVTQCTIFNDERNLIEMAKYKLPDIFRAELNPIELLALLQHHGIPTRLLDVTENALVALYFACADEKAIDQDGEVIVFKHNNNDVTNYPIVNAIADSYRFTGSTWTYLWMFYRNVNTQPYFLEHQLKNEICNRSADDGARWIAECCQNLFFIHAPIRSMRQQVQHGRYILFPNHIEAMNGRDCFVWQIAPIPKDHDSIEARFIIPKESKRRLLRDLSVLGITESFLFCDNVDTVCKGILDSFNRRY